MKELIVYRQKDEGQRGYIPLPLALRDGSLVEDTPENRKKLGMQC